MNGFLETVKAHPLAIGGTIAGVLAVYLLYNSGSTSNTTTAVTAPAPQDNSLAIAQLQVGASDFSVSAQLQAAQDTNNANVQLATLANSVQLATVNAEQQVQSFGIQKAADVAIAQVQGQTDIASLGVQNVKNQLDTQLAITDSNNQASEFSIATVAATQNHISDNQLASTKAVVDETQQAAQLQANVSLAQIQAAQFLGAKQIDSNDIIANDNITNIANLLNAQTAQQAKQLDASNISHQLDIYGLQVAQQG